MKPKTLRQALDTMESGPPTTEQERWQALAYIFRTSAPWISYDLDLEVEPDDVEKSTKDNPAPAPPRRNWFLRLFGL